MKKSLQGVHVAAREKVSVISFPVDKQECNHLEHYVSCAYPMQTSFVVRGPAKPPFFFPLAENRSSALKNPLGAWC